MVVRVGGKSVRVLKMRGVRPRARTGVRAGAAALLVSGLLSLQTVPQLSVRLNAPIVDAVHDPAGGYWEVAADGGVFARAGAGFFGSLPGRKMRIGTPIVGIAPTTNGRGYWLLEENGRVFAFGDARALGNAQNHAVAIVPFAKGYQVISSLGTSVAFLPAAKKRTKSQAAKSHTPKLPPTSPPPTSSPPTIPPPTSSGAALTPPATTPTLAPPATSSAGTSGATGATAPPSTSGQVDAATGSGVDNLVPPASLMPDSLFNQGVQSWPVDSRSAAFASDIVADYQSAYGAVATNTDRPVYWVPANQPLVPVTVAFWLQQLHPIDGRRGPDPPGRRSRRRWRLRPHRLSAVERDRLGVLAGQQQERRLVGMLGRQA